MEDSFVDRWRDASLSDRSGLMDELGFSIGQEPLKGWQLLYMLQSSLKMENFDAACCTRVALSLRPALKLLDEVPSMDDDEAMTVCEQLLQTMIIFVTECMGSVCLNKGPNLIYDALTHLYESSPRSALHVELVSSLQNCLVDYHVAVPENCAPSESQKRVKFWRDGIAYALEVSRFDPRSRQVMTLCRSIADSFFGGGKLAAAIVKLNDMTGRIDESRTDSAYLFDMEAAKLVKTFSEDSGALTGYSFLWALLEAFLLRVADDKDYLSALMLLVHLIQATGVQIKCMPTASILEYPQSQLDETERLFHVVKLLEIYIASGMYHPSVLVTTKKRFRGNLVFKDLLVFLLQHPSKGSADWYHAQMHLATIASTVSAEKLRALLQTSWLDCTPEDVVAQEEFLIFLVDLYDRMHKAADFYTRFLGAINAYLEGSHQEPVLSEALISRMRTSFTNLGPDDVIKIWTDYIRYLVQTLQKWKESGASLNRAPLLFVLKVFSEFIQHCPLIPLMEMNSEQQDKMDTAVKDTLTLTTLLRELISELKDKSNDFLPHYVIVMQKYITCRFILGYYIEDAVESSINDAAQLQEELVAFVENHFKTLKRNKSIRLEVLCASVKLTEESKTRANQCLDEICANFSEIDWQLLLCHHPQVVECASRKKIEHFIALLYQHVSDRKSCPYIESQCFRSDPCQVLAFTRRIIEHLAAAVGKTHPKLVKILDVANPESPVCWEKITAILVETRPNANLSEAVAQSKVLLSCVPVFCLPPMFRLKLLALTLALTLSHSLISDVFFADACYFLEDLTSTLKLEGICSDSDLALICRLATLCLERILALNSSLSCSHPSVRRILDLIHFVQFIALRRMTSMKTIRHIFKQFTLQSDAEFCAAFLLLETLPQIHHKSIPAEELNEFLQSAKQRVNKALATGAFKLHNMIYISSKYADVFGVADALKVQSVKLAFQSAGETLLSLKADGAAMRLCALALRDANEEQSREVVPVRSVVFCALLAGGENIDALMKTVNSTLAHELWPVLSSVMDDLQEIACFTESVASDASDLMFERSPFCLKSPEGDVTADDIFNRCLSFLPTLLRHAERPTIIAIIKKVSTLVANRSSLCGRSLRVDLCCTILDTASRRRPPIEALTSIYSSLARLPIKQIADAPVEQWSTAFACSADLVGRGMVLRAHQSSGVTQILLGFLGRLIEATLKLADRSRSQEPHHVAMVVSVIDKINRVLFLLHRLKRKKNVRFLDSSGTFLMAFYLRAAVKISLNAKLRNEVHAMAFMILNLCNSKGLFILKLESEHSIQEALRRLVEEYKSKFHVRRL